MREPCACLCVRMCMCVRACVDKMGEGLMWQARLDDTRLFVEVLETYCDDPRDVVEVG